MNRFAHNALVPTLLMCALSACSLWVAGCDRGAAEAPIQAPPVDSAVVLDTPQDTARSLVHFLQAHLKAIAEGNQAAAAGAREQVAWHIAARDRIIAPHRKTIGERPLAAAELLDRRAESWAAMISYYADGLAVDQTRVLEGGTKAREIVCVPVSGRDDREVLRITCVSGEDGKWHVRALDFAARETPVRTP